MTKINQIEQIFNDCLDAVMSGRSTIAECLERYPEFAAELEGLLLTSVGISKAASIAPPPGAKMRIRVALNERMAEISDRKAGLKPFWRFGWANAVVSVVLGLSIAGGGVAYAASQAMPDQALYPLKLDLEQAMVSLTFSSDAKVQLYAALNDRRVGEIVYLAYKGDSQGIAEVTSRIESNLSAAALAKGLSATEFAAAKAAAPANAQALPGTTTITDTKLPTTTPPVATGSTGGGTAVPPGSTSVPTTANPSPFNPPSANIPNSGAASLTLPSGGSAIDAGLLGRANSQINSLTGASNAGNSAAVQAALDRALAAIENGYAALISQP